MLRSRITGRHGSKTTSLLEPLLEASRRPDDAFEILIEVAEAHPEMKALLLKAANSATRRGYQRIRDVRPALVRIGVLAAARLMLEAAHREDPTTFGHAA